MLRLFSWLRSDRLFGRLPRGSIAWLLLANLATAASVWRRARIVRFAAKDI